jgi:hypothetical protein
MSEQVMTETIGLLTTDGQATVVMCACGHRLEHHDRIGLRYCQATSANSLSRGCICKES